MEGTEVANFLTLPYFFTCSDPGKEDPTPRGTRGDMCESQDRHSPMGPISKSFVASVGCSIFPYPTRGDVEEEVPTEGVLPSASTVHPLLYVPQYIPELRTTATEESDRFPRVPLVELSKVASPEEPREGTRLAVACAGGGEPVGHAMGLPVLLRDSPCTNIEHVDRVAWGRDAATTTTIPTVTLVPGVTPFLGERDEGNTKGADVVYQGDYL